MPDLELTRLIHRLVFVRHCLFMDDLIALLSGPSAPVWAALVWVPINWHKAYLGDRPTWVGWQMCFHSLSATMEPANLDRLRDLLAEVRSSGSVPLHLLRKLTGKLLCVCSLFRPPFRPSLAPLYLDQGKLNVVHVALSPPKWALFRSAFPNPLVLLSDVGLASCPTSCKLLSVSGKDVSTLAEVPVSFPGERRTDFRADACRIRPETVQGISCSSEHVEFVPGGLLPDLSAPAGP